MVLVRGLKLSGLGAVLGLSAAIPAARFLESQLHGMTPADPVTHLAVLVSLLAAGALASDLPARRAAALDPVETLKCS